MKYIIQTIGQRDVQMHNKTEESDYASFDKADLAGIQKKLEELLKDDQLKWKAISGKEGRQKITEEDLENSEKEICFPLTEKIISSLSKEEEYRFIILYTDRQKSQLDKKYIKNEPWLFANIIEKFWDDLIDHYNLNAKLMTLNICREMVGNWDINYDFAYRQMDKIAQFLLTSNKVSDSDKIYVYNSGGIPKIAQALDLALNAYFPKKVIFMEQDFGKISKSKQHVIQKAYSLKFSILQKLKQFDFAGAYKDAFELKLEQLDYSLWNLISACNSWLYDDSEISKKEIMNYINKSENPKLNKVLKKMLLMLNKKNAVGCNLLRTIQEARKENWWGMSTMLISVGELFIINKIKQLYYNSVTKDKGGRSWFDSSKIPFKIEIPAEEIKKIENRKNSKLYLTNWQTFAYLIKSGLKSSNNDNFKKLDHFFKSVRNLKTARNEFIHQGQSISKEVIDKYLILEPGIKSIGEKLNSKTFQYLITEIEKMPHIEFVNWLPILQKELIEQVKKLSPIQKQ